MLEVGGGVYELEILYLCWFLVFVVEFVLFCVGSCLFFSGFECVCGCVWGLEILWWSLWWCLWLCLWWYWVFVGVVDRCFGCFVCFVGWWLR